MGELLNPKYDREEAIDILVSFLDHADWSVRFQAAQLLSSLGSKLGFPVLRAAITARARGEDIPDEIVVHSAQTLHQFRAAIDKRDLFAAYRRSQSTGLLPLLVWQQVPEVADMVRQKRAASELGLTTEWMAAYLKMSDNDSIHNYEALLHSYPSAQLMANWALYRSTGDKGYLSYVVRVASEGVGLVPKTTRSDPLVTADAIHYLQITVSPESTQALRVIADYAATKVGDSINFDRAFAALFYLHKDDAYVDQRVLGSFQGKYSGPSVDMALMMQIAATRNTAELNAAAKAFKSEAYDREFTQLKGRPVESWISGYIGNIPVDVAPPLE